MIRGGLGSLLQLSRSASLIPASSQLDCLALPIVSDLPTVSDGQRQGQAVILTHACSAGSSSCFGGSLPWRSSHRSFASSITDDANYYVGLENLRDNPKATKNRIRAGRGDSSNRGNFGGKGSKGHNARSGGGPHLLYDGGQLGLIKFPIVRQRPSYEVLYSQLGLSRVIEYAQLGLLDTSRIITMKDLLDTGCVSGNIKYGVMLYGKVRSGATADSLRPFVYQVPHLPIPLHLEVTACDEDALECVKHAGGSVTRVYYTDEGLTALLKPQKYTSKNLPLPLPAHSWHPRYNSRFDAIGQIPPATQITEKLSE